MATAKKSRGASGTNSNSSAPKGYTRVSGGGMIPAKTWKKGDTLEGKIQSVRTVETGKGKQKKQSRIMSVITTDGEIVAFWETATLRGVFELKNGAQIYIRYNGTKKIAGRAQPMHDFEAFYK